MDKIVLTDESGKEIQVELIDSFGFNEENYAVFSSGDDESLYILRIEYSLDGEVYFSGIEDDDEVEELVEVYNELKEEDIN